MTRSVEFSIQRYNPEKDEKPYMQNYVLRVGENEDIMLLTALLRLKDEQDETLTFRRSCAEGVCGSDGMNVNGRNILACITPLSSLIRKKLPINIMPLTGLEVIRDLSVNMKSFLNQYEKVKPYLINDEAPPIKERLQTPEERDKLNGLTECILCACCTSACPSYWWNPKDFLGPAALLWLYRFLADSRDTDAEARLEQLNDAFSLYRCRSIMNCTSVCPKGLNPAEAINKIRSKMLETNA